MTAQTSPSTGLRDRILDYLAGEASVEDLGVALGSALWDSEEDPSLDPVTLAYAELTNGDRSEDEFRSILEELVTTCREHVAWDVRRFEVIQGSDSSTTHSLGSSVMPAQWTAADTPNVAALA